MENREETTKSHRDFAARVYVLRGHVLVAFESLLIFEFVCFEERYVSSRVYSPLFYRLIAMARPLAEQPTLTSLPPECLLAIISYLPPTSYSSLVHTSHSFLQFFAAHAATICNNHILAHYAPSSSYLDSIYIDGWLVPSHSSITIQERLLLSPPVRPTSTTPIFVGKADQGAEQALHIFSEGVKGRLLLSSPGPQYLSFLAQYDFEIRTRREMADREHADEAEVGMKIDGKEIEAKEQDDRDIEERTRKTEKIEDRFAYMVGTYAIRFFLRRLDDFAGALEESRIAEGRRRLDEVLDRARGTTVKTSFASRVKTIRKELASGLRGFTRKLRKEKRELCFGELESDDETEKGTVCRPIRDGVIEALLWYYGPAGVLAFRGKRQGQNSKAENVDGAIEVSWRMPID